MSNTTKKIKTLPKYWIVGFSARLAIGVVLPLMAVFINNAILLYSLIPVLVIAFFVFFLDLYNTFSAFLILSKLKKTLPYGDAFVSLNKMTSLLFLIFCLDLMFFPFMFFNIFVKIFFWFQFTKAEKLFLSNI